jgi:hypothetical protein
MFVKLRNEPSVTGGFFLGVFFVSGLLVGGKWAGNKLI